MLDAAHSSALTGFAGWAYHFSNGIGFGITYAAVALGRRWPWAVLWGVVLETATIVSPFADSYGIRGHWDLIAIAYAAHLAYGIPLGLIVQRATDWDPERPLVPPISVWIGGLVVALGLWLHPWSATPPATGVVVDGGRFRPEWTRVAPGECVRVRNADDEGYKVGGTTLPPNATADVCLVGIGAHRVKLSGEPYSGGFVLVDPEA